MRPGCKFAHPTDPEWKISPESKRTPYSAGKYSNRRSSRSRSPRRFNRARSRSTSPTRDRRASHSESRMDSRAGPSDSYRGSRSSVPSHSPAPSRPLPPPFSAPPVLPPPSLPGPPPMPAAFSASEYRTPKPSTGPEMKVMWEKILPWVSSLCLRGLVHNHLQTHGRLRRGP